MFSVMIQGRLELRNMFTDFCICQNNKTQFIEHIEQKVKFHRSYELLISLGSTSLTAQTRAD